MSIQTLQYDSLFSPQSFWPDYSFLAPSAQKTADFMIGLDELFGCWEPPQELKVPAPIETILIPFVPPSSPTAPTIPEIPTIMMFAMGLVFLVRRRRA